VTYEEIEALADDIRENGLRHPIVRYQGQILDGRNRLLACEKAGREPVFTDHEGDEQSAQDLVDSLNIQRRELTNAQRAIVAARRLQREEKATGRKPGNNGEKVGRRPTIKTVDRLAKGFKTGSKSIQQARSLLENAPDLAAQVESGALRWLASLAIMPPS
jgi:ParB-like chromosome segregation protein Spo0J